MARIGYVQPENASPEVKRIYEEKLRGKPLNLQKALAHRPELLNGFLAFYASVGKSLDRRLFELVYIRVSMVNGCMYCLQHHVAASKRLGLGLEDWRGLEKPLESPRFSETEKVALAYAERLTRTPTNDIEPEVSLARKHFNDEQMVDLTAVIALANLTNRLNDGLGIEFEGTPETL
jgi:uncharacterized peroxidase-related enzyme